MSILIRAGTRPSKLALLQVNEIKKLMPQVSFEVVIISTKGDKDKKTPLSLCEGGDFFTYEIDKALAGGDIDIAIHSAKDLKVPLLEGLVPAAITDSISPYDCLVSAKGQTLDTLKKGAVIGISSKNRTESILRYRSDLVTKAIRGNVDERIDKLDKGYFDAIIVAHCALIRLGLEQRIAQIIPTSIIKSHPSQGALAVVIRKKDKELKKLFKTLDAGANKSTVYAV